MFQKSRNHLFIALIMWGILIMLPYNACAYIDPNTGGFFFTSVLPFVYGLLGAMVIFWKRIIGFIRHLFTKKKEK